MNNQFLAIKIGGEIRHLIFELREQADVVLFSRLGEVTRGRFWVLSEINHRIGDDESDEVLAEPIAPY